MPDLPVAEAPGALLRSASSRPLRLAVGETATGRRLKVTEEFDIAVLKAREPRAVPARVIAEVQGISPGTGEQ